MTLPRATSSAGGLACALRADLAIGARSRSLRLAILLPAVAACGRIVAGKARQAAETARVALSGHDGAGGGGNAWGPLADGLAAGLFTTALLAIAIGAHGLAADRERGTARHLLIQRVSRRQIVLARCIYVHALAAMSIAAAVVASIAAAAALFDFGPVTESGYVIIDSREALGEIVRGALLALAPLSAMIAASLLIGIAARSAAEAVGIALALALGLDLLEGPLGDLAGWLPSTWLPGIVDRSALGAAARLARGYSDVVVDPAAARLEALVPWPWILILLGLTLHIATRRRL